MIAAQVKYHRTMQNLTQRELAECAEVDKSYIGNIEAYDTVPRLDVALRIAEALEVSIYKLIEPLTAEQALEASEKKRRLSRAKREANRSRYNERRRKRRAAAKLSVKN